MPKPKEYKHLLGQPIRKYALGYDWILVKTLPVRPDVVANFPVLLEFIASEDELKSMSPNELTTCVNKLERVVRFQLETFEVEKQKPAAQWYFGYTPDSAGTSIGERERAIAEMYDDFSSTKSADRLRVFKIIPAMAWRHFRSGPEMLRWLD